MRASQRLASFVLILAVLLSNGEISVLAATTPADTAAVAGASSSPTSSPTSSSPVKPSSPSTPRPSAPTAFNNSLNIDVTGYVSVTHNSAIQPTVAATYEAWIRRTNPFTGCQAILGKDITQGYWLGICNNVIRFYSGGSGSGQDGATAIPTGVWTHIAVVWDTVSNTRQYYINGDLEYSSLTAGPAPAGTRELRIGDDGVNSDQFSGNVSEVRIWNVARSQDDIRHTMHEALQAPLPGLVADWHLSDDYKDSIGGFNGVPIGPVSLLGPQAPPQPVYVTVDKDFNTLPYGRYGAATVYLPNTNQALLIGGVLNGTITNHIDTVDVATGKTNSLGNLPSNRDFLSAVYDPDKNSVYVFGGSDTTNGSTFADTIYAIDFPTGTVRTLAATLPTPAYGIGAVYDAQQKRIYLLGGYSGSVLTSVNVFDPQTETMGTTSVTLSQPDYQMAAIYSPLSDRIYSFGGLTTGSTAVNTIYSLNFTSATAGSLAQLPAHLPQADIAQNAVQDSHTGLIYLIGGQNTDQVLAFDPMTNDLWSTLIKLPQTQPYAGAVYSDRNRHALFIGGGVGNNLVYRIPIGDGPSVPVGRWDFPQAVGQAVNSIAGQKNVYVGTNGEGFWRYYSNGTRFQIPGGDYGSAGGVVNGMYYSPNTNLLWFGTNDAYFWSYDGSALVGYNNSNTTNALVNPVYSTDGIFFGHGNGAVWQSFNSVWNNSLSNNVTSLASRAGDPAPFGEFTEWAAVGTLIIPKPSGPSTRGANAPNNNYGFDYRLHRLTFNLFVGGSGTDANYGTPCGYATINDIRFDRNGDFFIPNGAGVCFIGNNPNYTSTLSGNEIFPLIGGQPVQASMDADGRIWVASLGNGGSPFNSGGVIAYEAVGNWPTITVTTSEFNWLNAPVGSRIYGNGNWLSRFNAVGAIDERVWAGRTDGQLVTLAQRWQQIDQSDNISSQAIENIWMARGRAFLSENSAVGGSLFVLMPDGKTWDNRSGVHARSVLGDSQGRIWVGTDNDVRLYTPTGWITFTASLDQGTPPIGPVYSLAEDQQGRIWIGSANGLTLFDRNRFVFTLNKTNFGLPDAAVHALTVDRDNAVWVGTNSGLAKVDSGTVVTYTAASGLPSLSIYSLATTGDGTLAVSTDNGFAVLTGTTFITESLPIPATNLPLALDNLGHVWAGSAVRTGSNQWFAYYNNNSGLRSSTVSGVAADGADKVWFSHAPDTGISVRSAFLPPLSDSVPIISSITPDHGSSGDLITINGTGFGSNAGSVQVTIGGGQPEVLSVAPTAIVVRLNSDNVSGDVDVRVGKRHTTLAGSTQPAFCAVPKIYSYSPTGGDYGVIVDVKGGNIDPGFQLNVGSGPVRQPSWDTPRHFRYTITSGDTTGNLKLTNLCPNTSTTDSREFRVITLGIDRVVLNQGIPSYELVTQRPTLLEHFLTRSIDPRQDDQLALDSLDLEITDLQTNQVTYKTVPYNGTVPTTLGAPSATILLDTVNSINVPDVFLNTDAAGGSVQIKSILKNHGMIVAQTTTTAKLAGNLPVRVLLIPFMHVGFSASDLNSMEANVNKDLGPLTYRLMPQGRVQWYWSDEVLTSGSVDIGNVLALYGGSHAMDTVRKNWNKTHSQSQVVVAFGVIDGQIATGGADGQAFWPDLSSILNHTALVPFEALCGLANTAVKIFSFGLAGDACNVDIPLFVGWARGDRADSSALFAHELGHISELVKSGAINGSLTNNFSHSVNDEISDGECGNGTTYDFSLSLYAQPGVSEPVVDPITGNQLRPHPSDNTPDDQNFGRGKAIMSYACAKDTGNVFFEPADYNTVRAPVNAYFAQQGSQMAQQLMAAAHWHADAPTTTIPGPRLFVSGAITQSNNTANFISVERPDSEPPLSPDFVTGYDLVQRGATGTELSRLGVYPIFTGIDAQDLAVSAPTTSTTNNVGFFSATALRATGVVTLELQHNGVVIARFHAGNATPTINLSSPTAGTYNSSVPVTWSAADADGDPLTISIEYSRDGSQWQQVGQGIGNSGTINVPTFLLGGSNSARMRAFASDGFNVGVYTSTQFIVPNQPPQPSIATPQSGATFLEGQTLNLTGSALDRQDGVITDTQLIWRSSRDGLLGTGPDLPAILSVGVHTITLQATNSAGLSATTHITLSVLGDYVMDGIPDSQKLANGWNPLDDKLAYSDPSGSGIPLIMKLKRGNIITDTFPPDRLIVGPTVITFTADLTDAMPFPQQPVVIASHNPVSWTLSANVPWLTSSAASGQTPEGVTIEALPYSLNNGSYRGVISFTSPQLSNVVTVTVNLTVIDAARNCDVNRDGVNNATDVQLVQNAIGTNYTQPNFNLRYDLNRDGAVTQADVTLVQACIAMAAANKLYLPVIRK